jgi:predicted ABC-type ATPase
LPKKQRIIIIAGPNGAGKTTFAREYLLKEAHCPDYINVDLIAAGLSPFKPETVGIQAGRIMLLRFKGVSESARALRLKLR